MYMFQREYSGGRCFDVYKPMNRLQILRATYILYGHADEKRIAIFNLMKTLSLVVLGKQWNGII